MKSTVRYQGGRGIVAGWLLFLVLAALAYLTPARLPVMRFAGRDYTALTIERRAREQVLHALQPKGHAPSLARDQEPAVERAQTALTDAETRLVAWSRANARISPFGFLGWLSDLWPWLLGLGIGLPVLGGLIGVQIRESRDAAAGRSASNPSASGIDLDPHSNLNSSLASTSLSTSASESAVPPPAPVEPSSWSWGATPVVRPAQPRPKIPPVKSPHGLDGEA